MARSIPYVCVCAVLRLTFPVREGVLLKPFQLEHGDHITQQPFHLKESVYGMLLHRYVYICQCVCQLCAYLQCMSISAKVGGAVGVLHTHTWYSHCSICKTRYIRRGAWAALCSSVYWRCLWITWLFTLSCFLSFLLTFSLSPLPLFLLSLLLSPLPPSHRNDLELQFKCYHGNDKLMLCQWPQGVAVNIDGRPLPIDRVRNSTCPWLSSETVVHANYTPTPIGFVSAHKHTKWATT